MYAKEKNSTMNNPETYETVRDFLNDNSFIEWQLSGNKDLGNKWLNFIRKHPCKQDIFDEAVRRIRTVRFNACNLSEESEQEMCREIIRRVRLYKKRRRLKYFALSAAASVFLGLLMTFYQTTHKKPDAGRSVASHDAIPETNRLSEEIQLITENNVLKLNQNAEIVLSADGNALFTDSLQGKQTIGLSEEKLNKLIVPYGKRASVLLSDGTHVWLNSGTELEFPALFSGGSRAIRVSGEIFIDVAKQGKPFLVHTLHTQIEVFGTSFNVSAYREEDKEAVVLVEGSVKVKNNKDNTTVVLSPNQMAEVENGNIKSKTVDVSEYIGWKSGFIQFNKTAIDEVLKKVSRYYNVEFKCNENLQLGGKTCSGKLFLSDDIDDVLKAFADITLLNYEKTDNRTIFIKK